MKHTVGKWKCNHESIAEPLFVILCLISRSRRNDERRWAGLFFSFAEHVCPNKNVKNNQLIITYRNKIRKRANLSFSANEQQYYCITRHLLENLEMRQAHSCSMILFYLKERGESIAEFSIGRATTSKSAAGTAAHHSTAAGGTSGDRELSEYISVRDLSQSNVQFTHTWEATIISRLFVYSQGSNHA